VRGVVQPQAALRDPAALKLPNRASMCRPRGGLRGLPAAAVPGTSWSGWWCCDFFAQAGSDARGWCLGPGGASSSCSPRAWRPPPFLACRRRAALIRSLCRRSSSPFVSSPATFLAPRAAQAADQEAVRFDQPRWSVRRRADIRVVMGPEARGARLSPRGLVLGGGLHSTARQASAGTGRGRPEPPGGRPTVSCAERSRRASPSAATSPGTGGLSAANAVGQPLLP